MDNWIDIVIFAGLGGIACYAAWQVFGPMLDQPVEDPPEKSDWDEE